VRHCCATYGSNARLLAAHRHNEEGAAQQVIARLAAGESVAMVVDAGTPAISDPGARLVARVRAAGHRVIPSARCLRGGGRAVCGGLSEAHFLFYGFCRPRPGSARRSLRELAPLPYALVFYEAPHRILEAVAALAVPLDRNVRWSWRAN
jgi:16S rRNA (cytidine1402-2'-O)-methyltransferase